jgi:hypothetical protein
MFAADLFMFSNTQLYLQSLDSSNTFWAPLVQSGLSPMVPAAASLQGRSASMVLALLTIHVSTITLTMYVAYMSHWVELREWLRAKSCLAPPARPGLAACPVLIEGVPLTKRQLLAMCSSKYATILLDCPGVLGHAAMILLHVGALNVLCMLALLASQIVMLRVAPSVLPSSMMHMYFPLRPELEMGECSADSPPQFSGLFGRLLLLLA